MEPLTFFADHPIYTFRYCDNGVKNFEYLDIKIVLNYVRQKVLKSVNGKVGSIRRGVELSALRGYTPVISVSIFVSCPEDMYPPEAVGQGREDTELRDMIQ